MDNTSNDIFMLPQSTRVYAHIDCDCFFASCEILRNPKLRGKCVCVWGDIVLTSSYEARKYGVKLGVARWDVDKMIPRHKLAFLPPDMAFYGKTSDRMMWWLREQTLQVEVFSIDECWVDITGIPECLWLTYEEYAAQLRDDIRKTIGIPVSIGVATTRLRAKILSELKKPYWVTVAIHEQIWNWESLSIPYGDIPFIGPRLQERLKYDLRSPTVGSFMSLGYQYPQRKIGKSATDVWWEMMWVNAYQSKDPYQHEKTMSATRSFNKEKTSNKWYIYQHLLINYERAYSRLIDKNLEAKRVIISYRVMWPDRSYRYGVEKVFARHTNQNKTMKETLLQLFADSYNPNYLYHGTGVHFTHLHPYLPKQYELGETIEVQDKQEQDVGLEKVINVLNAKYGKQMVSHGGSQLVDPRYYREHLWEPRSKEQVKRIRGFMDIDVS